MAEFFSKLRVVNHLFPFAGIGVNQQLHLLFQLISNTQGIVYYYRFEILHAALQLIYPGSGTVKVLCCFDIKHQETIQILNTGLIVYIAGQQLGMLRVSSPIASYKQVPSLFGGNDTKIFGLRLGTFTYTTRNSSFELMRSPQPTISLFNLQRKRHRIVQAITAPGGSHTAFNRSQRFTVGMPTFEAGLYELFPYVRKLIYPGSHHVDTLASGNFGIKPILFCNLPNDNQLVGGYFTAGHTRNDRIRNPTLD